MTRTKVRPTDKEFLQHRATYLEALLDNSSEPSLPEHEEELCSIYKILNVMETML